jgi:DNA-damage-inducible protein D
MKRKWRVPKSRPLADFAPEVAIVAKQLGAAMTTHNVKRHDLRGEEEVTIEHVQNNERVRGTLKDRGIVLEMEAGEEDIKKVERRHASEAKKLTALTTRRRKPTAKRPRG